VPPSEGEKGTPPRLLRIGEVAYAPSAVTVFENLRRYFTKCDLPVDYVLCSNYDALVDALRNVHADIAWNTPSAHPRNHLACDSNRQTLVMRHVGCNFRCNLLIRNRSGIKDPTGLQATVLPLHCLKSEGVNPDTFKALRLDEEQNLWVVRVPAYFTS
jgi:phosphonate transport system substrate-binding protein